MDARFAKQRWLALGGVIFLLLLSGCSGAANKASMGPTQSPQRKVIGFVFAYGIQGAKNVLDTERGTFTKDMILASPVTVPMRLTGEEFARITARMEEIDFFSYPSVFAPEGSPETDPFPPIGMEATYRFAVRTEAGVKSVEWTVQWLPRGRRALGLSELAHLIEQIIEAKPEYKALPAPEGGYS